MAKQTTRDAALSRLFGNSSVQSELDEPKARQPAGPARAKPRTKASRQPSGSQPPSKEGGGEGDQPLVESVADVPASPSAYIGLGRYARTDGVVERITPYVRPDQAEALRLAAARKNDPRGTDISQIVQAILDEAGYRA